MSRPSLQSMLADAQSGVLLFGITPPRLSTTPDRIKEITAITLARLSALDLDGLILYDIADEADRNAADRPFPYLPTLDPASFHAEHLGEWDRPTIIYRCVGKYDEDELSTWLGGADPQRVLSVFVGASSGDQPVRTSLRRAQELRAEIRPDLHLGAVVISERHTRSGDEHLRMLAKQERGCGFFISQVIYDASGTKNLISDYFYACRDRGIQPRPVIFTLSLCGSEKTLEFLKWLGVDVPRWMANALRHAADPLEESYRECLAIAQDLRAFCLRLGMPYGFHVESVSIRKAEIEGATRLTAEIGALLRA